jgi:uncharacterized protein CbrC (UPF0167 family)
MARTTCDRCKRIYESTAVKKVKVGNKVLVRLCPWCLDDFADTLTKNFKRV